MRLDLIIPQINRKNTSFIIRKKIVFILCRMDLHQMSRFLSADEYERLIFNHRRKLRIEESDHLDMFFPLGIRSLLEELGCSTSSNGDNEQSQSSISAICLVFKILYFSLKEKNLR